ncbi:RNA methyltransferase [Brachybacterium endophyticum]|uniref:RNA methyltransferase n=1 Tax=Brachybacterium endophyticum TaxID=2182385 RepID=A0A2U2RGZ2_9MICO|nr:RNA methyltransferase [Brachybacterium endophyticum]PWH05118.1 RNA methyltransferase [Brachybacterium endophyticum]
MSTTGRPDSWAITSPRSDRVKRIAALSGRSARRRHGRFRVEGPQAVRSLLQHRAQAVRELYVTFDGADAAPEILDLAETSGITAREVSSEILRAMTRGEDPADGMASPQGVLAVADIAQRSLTDVLTGLPSGPATVLVLHEVQDPGNVGTLIRAADASGADAVLATTGTADFHAPKVVRSATGSLFHLPVVTGIAPEALFSELRDAGVSVLATSGYAESDLYAAKLPSRSAWVMGNEARGLPESVLADADLAVRIPLAGDAESLNVAIAATVCLFETLRRR